MQLETHNYYVNFFQGSALPIGTPLRKFAHRRKYSILRCRSNSSAFCCQADCTHGSRTRTTRLILVYVSVLPSLEETKTACQWFEDKPLQSTTDIFLEMYEHYGDRHSFYKFTNDAQTLLDQLQRQEIAEINVAISEGNPPPKCKKMDIYCYLVLIACCFRSLGLKPFHRVQQLSQLIHSIH